MNFCFLFFGWGNHHSDQAILMIQGTPISRSTERLNQIQSTIITALRIFTTKKIVYLTISISLSRCKESQPNNSFNYDALSYLLIGGDKVFEIANLKKVLLDCIAMRCYLSPQCNLIRPLGCRFSALCSTGKIQYYAESSIRCTQKKPHELYRTASIKKSNQLNGGWYRTRTYDPLLVYP